MRGVPANRQYRSVAPCAQGVLGRLVLVRLAIVVLLACVAQTATAQTIPAGEQAGRERERFIERRAPAAQPVGERISLPSTAAPAGAADTMVVIRRIQIVGSTVYGADQLAAMYDDMLGRRVPLQAVYDLAQRITARYGGDGYALSRAIVPPQELRPSGASVRIEVIEGWINKVDWPKQLARYRDFFSVYAAKITADRPVNVRTIERYLLLASDLPGLKFSTTLKASPNEKGASTLIVEVVEKRFEALGRIDNRGTSSRGPWQFTTSGTLNNVFGNHEAVSLLYAGAFPLETLQFIAPSYRQVLNAEGLSFFVNGSYSWGKPGIPNQDVLKFTTRSTVVESGMSTPIVRTRERNLTVTALFFLSESYSFLDGTAEQVDRLRGVRLRSDADFADMLGGINQISTTFSKGINGLGSTGNSSDPLGLALPGRPSVPNGRVDFTKLDIYASRLQPLPGQFSALIAGYAQYAFTSLLVPEQCGYGGRTFGRAYNPSELLGDHCWMASAELRYDVPGTAMPFPAVQFYGFTDRGTSYFIAPGVGTPGSQSGASAGGGVRLAWLNHLQVDLSAAKAIEGPRNDSRFFVISTARY